MVLIAGLFLMTQSFSVAHASTYGDAPHEHDGIACIVTALNDEDVAPLLNTGAFQIEPVLVSGTFDVNFYSTTLSNPQSRGPPPRAPPASIA